MPETYSTLLEELKHRGLFQIKPGLERVQAVLEALGHPENRIPAIHIAGTNGKGSVAASLESILRHAGYRTGFYLSPHLVDWLERFRIAGSPISSATLVAAARSVLAVEDRLKVQLTHFEFLTVAAFVLMAKADCDILILETGMGGRWDATNAIEKPLVSVITSIGLDHTQWLGSTEKEIAGEKAGIVKAGVPVVSGVRGPGQSVIRRAARAHQSDFRQLAKDFFGRRETTNWKQGTQTVAYRSSCGDEKKYTFALVGEHQAENAAVALATIDVLRNAGWSIAESAVRQGLRRVEWPGRFQILPNRGFAPLLLDGAHNPHALRHFLQTLDESPFGDQSKTFIFSAYRDKDYKKMASLVMPRTSSLFLCSLPGQRGLSPAELRETFKKSRFAVRVAGSPSDALRRAYQETPVDGVVIGTGSLALVGMLLKAQTSFFEVEAVETRTHRG